MISPIEKLKKAQKRKKTFDDLFFKHSKLQKIIKNSIYFDEIYDLIL